MRCLIAEEKFVQSGSSLIQSILDEHHEESKEILHQTPSIHLKQIQSLSQVEQIFLSLFRMKTLAMLKIDPGDR
jgi:hypothetical protein